MVEELFRFELAAERGGWFTAKTALKESELQGRLRDHLRSAGMEVAEGEEVGGGETDLVAAGSIVIENKVHGSTKEPLGTTHKYQLQARRYSVAICERVYLVCMAYKCEAESTMLPIPERIRVVPSDSDEDNAQVRFVVPYGHSVPSEVKSA